MKLRIPFVFLVCLFVAVPLVAANAMVAQDGSGDYRTVQEAINAAPQTLTADNRWVIFIKTGTYREMVYVQREKHFVTLVGEDPLRTVITYTLLVNRGRHYFEDSLITGHVDFIFGAATAFFERCRIHVWRNGYITAASTPADQLYGFVFDHNTISGESSDVKTYLGRPWRDFAQVTFLNTEMSAVVRPVGWNNWDRPDREQTSRYSEFGSTGPGGKQAERAAWARPIIAKDTNAITVAAVLGGADHWDPREVAAHPSAVKVMESPLPSAPGH